MASNTVMLLFQGDLMVILNYEKYVGNEEIAGYMKSAYTYLMAGKGEEAKSEIDEAAELSKKAGTALPRCTLMKMVYDDVLVDLSGRMHNAAESAISTGLRAIGEEDASKYTDIMLDAALIHAYASVLNELCGPREIAW